ncbi:hypothetical protein P353_23175 [Comamonas testosteroni]|uniref:Uncharacterized protein n=1 Tax=Comamonas testosteroni TaxID=285 RepID=A0A096F7W9_COMTE|nr:hypothetical protein P353_23175 [Comamonas testosteroni]
MLISRMSRRKQLLFFLFCDAFAWCRIAVQDAVM